MALWRTDPFYENTLSKLTSFPSLIRELYIGGFHKMWICPVKEAFEAELKNMQRPLSNVQIILSR